MLVCLGDLVDDVIVHQRAAAFSFAADTESYVSRRRGGSAANVVATAQRIGTPARLLAAAGADRVGDGLVDDLRRRGIDTRFIQRRGRSGAVVLLVDHTGERSMLTDRGTSADFRPPPRTALRGTRALHIPLYSLAEPPLAHTATGLAKSAHERGLLVTVDASSASLLDELGRARVGSLLDQLDPFVVLANADEAQRIDSAPNYLVAKAGSGPTTIIRDGHAVGEVPAIALTGVDDTTGAGDAFAAGMLTGLIETPDELVGACHRGHLTAAALLVGRGAGRQHER